MPANRIHKKADGRYSYSATDATGKRHYLASKKGEGQKAFSRRCDVLDKTLQGASGSLKMTFGELFDMWSSEYLPTRSVAHMRSMRAQYVKHVEVAFAIKRIDEINTHTIYLFLQSKIKEGYSKSMIGKLRHVLSGPFAWGVRSGLLAHNPCEGIRLNYTTDNQRKSPNVALTDDQIAQFFRLADRTKHRGYFRMLLYTGMRPSEALGLKYSDIYDGLIHVSGGVTNYEDSKGKTVNAIRSIPITDAIRSVLDDQQGATWVFTDTRPKMSAVISAFKRIRSQLDYQVTIYSFRTTFATRMARAGMAPKTLQYIMGHADIKTTLDFYVRIQDQDMTVASQIMSVIVDKIEDKP